MDELPSTLEVGSAAIWAIELRPHDSGYNVTGVSEDGTPVSSGPVVQDVQMGIALARGIVRLAQFQQEGDVFRARTL